MPKAQGDGLYVDTGPQGWIEQAGMKCRNIEAARRRALREKANGLAPLKSNFHLSTDCAHGMALATFDENSAGTCNQPPYEGPPPYIAFSDEHRWPHAIQYENIQP